MSVLTEMKIKERRDRKDLIIDAAERVFSTRPFNRVSMREIAGEAGIAPSSIYTYFPNQEALFVEATIRDSNLLIEEIGGIVEGTRSGRPVLDRVIDSFIEFISRHDSYFRMMVVFMTIGSLSPESLKKLNDVVRRGFRVFEAAFKKMGYRGNSRILAYHIFAMLNGILVTYRKLPGRDDEKIIAHMKRVAKVFRDLLQSKIRKDRQ
ncbi:MAG: TetR/AcrR family transcriptional regulator [Spirochaetes bacterium]|jgi:AcrR family transcriptional regulator|nr:TetR/AcrR family transcriptional regulator [Spirochaetota bacterium]